MIRLGLIGANNQGREHLEANPECDLYKFISVFDTNETVLEEVKQDFEGIETFTDRASFFKSDVDGYVLALPHHVYEGIWPDLMKQGKPLLKEKPLGRNLKEAVAFLDQCEEANVPLVTAIQRRKHESYSKLHALLANKEIEEVSATLHLGFDPNERPRSWRGDATAAGGGALLDSGYHMVDLVYYLLGGLSFIQSHILFNGSLGTADMIDTDVSLTARYRQAWVRIESRVGGEKIEGKYQKKELVKVKTTEGIYEANREWIKKDGEIVFECSRSWGLAMASQLEHFAEAIRVGNFHRPEIVDQLPIMRIVEKAYQLASLQAPFKGGYDE